ncbi:MAG: hypothetical protein AAFO15_01690, partial [Pseudomonadota bacterium]
EGDIMYIAKKNKKVYKLHIDCFEKLQLTLVKYLTTNKEAKVNIIENLTRDKAEKLYQDGLLREELSKKELESKKNRLQNNKQINTPMKVKESILRSSDSKEFHKPIKIPTRFEQPQDLEFSSEISNTESSSQKGVGANIPAQDRKELNGCEIDKEDSLSHDGDFINFFDFFDIPSEDLSNSNNSDFNNNSNESSVCSEKGYNQANLSSPVFAPNSSVRKNSFSNNFIKTIKGENGIICEIKFDTNKLTRKVSKEGSEICIDVFYQKEEGVFIYNKSESKLVSSEEMGEHWTSDQSDNSCFDSVTMKEKEDYIAVLNNTNGSSSVTGYIIEQQLINDKLINDNIIDVLNDQQSIWQYHLEGC